jgi:hypothetical protein
MMGTNNVWASWTKNALIQEIQDRMRHFYGQTDDTMNFPNSAEGDLLKMVHVMLSKTDEGGVSVDNSDNVPRQKPIDIPLLEETLLKIEEYKRWWNDQPLPYSSVALRHLNHTKRRIELAMTGQDYLAALRAAHAANVASSKAILTKFEYSDGVK